MRYHGKTFPAGLIRRMQYGAYGESGAISALCGDYNRATNPYAMRTEHEHKRFAQQAKAIRNRLRRCGASVWETESGLFFPTHS